MICSAGDKGGIEEGRGVPTLIVSERLFIWHFTPLSFGEGQGGEARLGVRLFPYDSESMRWMGFTASRAMAGSISTLGQPYFRAL